MLLRLSARRKPWVMWGIVNGKYRKSTAAQYDFAAIIERAQQDLQSGGPCGQLPFQRQVGVNF